MAKHDGMYFKWYAHDFEADAGKLNHKQTGLWIHCINAVMLSLTPGSLTCTLGEFEDRGSPIENTWRTMVELAAMNMGDFSVRREGVMVGINLHNAEEMRGLRVDGMTLISVRCRRVEKDWEVMEKEHQRKLRYWDSKGKNNRKASSTASSTPSSTPSSTAHDAASSIASSRDISSRSSRSSRKEIENTLSPATSGETPISRNRKAGRVEINTPMMIEIGSWFGRKPTTLWAKVEAAALAAAKPSEDEVALLRRYYTSKHPEVERYRRHQIDTLLNNWPLECDRASEKLAKYGGDEKRQAVMAQGADMAVI